MKRGRERERREEKLLPSVAHKQGLCVGGVNRAAPRLLCGSKKQGVLFLLLFSRLAERMKHEVISQKSVGFLGILNHLN